MKKPRPRSNRRHAGDPFEIRSGRASTERVKVISQELLATFRRRKAEKEKAERSHAGTRQAILDLVDAGAKTEPGALAIQVSSYEACYFSARNLMAILGEDKVEWLRKQIPPTPKRILRVFEADDTEGNDGC
jgi:hypothetical protein